MTQSLKSGESDAPKSLGDSEVKRTRLRQRRDPHVAPLTDLVDSIRKRRECGNAVPYFDPLDGGVKARVLFLLEAPGPKAIASGFVSRNNPDETAKNMFNLLRGARLERKETVLWNIVPWFVGTNGKIAPVKLRDLRAAQPYLLELLEKLPKLEAIVLLGNNAQNGWRKLEHGTRWKVFESPHPSPVVFATKRDAWNQIRVCLAEVRAYLDSNGDR